jgi:hypothetical protein
MWRGGGSARSLDLPDAEATVLAELTMLILHYRGGGARRCELGRRTSGPVGNG